MVRFWMEKRRNLIGGLRYEKSKYPYRLYYPQDATCAMLIIRRKNPENSDARVYICHKYRHNLRSLNSQQGKGPKQ